MLIAGLQKMTLLDYPGKVACTVFLGGCNFRCPYCHNSELIAQPQELMTQQELLALLQKRRGLLDAVCISGGEPTLQKDLPTLIRAIKAKGFLVKLDTNGSRPEALKALAAEGLVDYVAMDVKSSPDGYAAACGCEVDMAAVEESLRFLLEGSVDYELRTTVVSPIHTEKEIRELGEWLAQLSPKKARRFFLQPFVDRDTVLFSGLASPGEADLAGFAQILAPYVGHVTLRGQ